MALRRVYILWNEATPKGARRRAAAFASAERAVEGERAGLSSGRGAGETTLGVAQESGYHPPQAPGT